MKRSIDSVYSLSSSSVVSKEQALLAEDMIIALLEQKRKLFSAMDEKQQAAALRKDEQYLDVIGYEEEVRFGNSITNLRSLFRKIAKDAGLFRMNQQKELVVNDLAFVDHFAFKSQQWFHGRKDDKSLKMPNFAVFHGGRNAEFMLASKAAEAADRIKMDPKDIQATLRRGGRTVAIKTYADTVRPDEAPQAPQAQESAQADSETLRLQKQIEELKAANAALAARKVVETPGLNGTSVH